MKNHEKRGDTLAHTNETVLAKIYQLYESVFRHDGFGELRVEVRLLKRGQKEIIIHCGKQYRYVVDYPSLSTDEMNSVCK